MSGNLTAQKELYKKYKKIVTDFIRNKYNSCELDDDVSEIMIKVILSLSTFDSQKSKFKSWVLSIAQNYMIDKWRCGVVLHSSPEYSQSYNSGGEYDGINLSNSMPEWTNTIVTCTTISSNNLLTVSNNCDFENCDSISHISSQISSTDYTLLDMKYVQGYEYCEIGKEFNISSNTASNRVNYLKTKLKKNNFDLY